MTNTQSDQTKHKQADMNRQTERRPAPIWPLGLIFVLGALLSLGSLIGEIPISENAAIGIGFAICIGILLFRIWFVSKTNETRATLAMRARIKRGLRDKT